MPYTSYHLVTDEDMKALYAYFMQTRPAATPNRDNEVGFLEPLRRIAKSGKSPAHDLLDRYEGPWDHDLSRIYDELSF